MKKILLLFFLLLFLVGCEDKTLDINLSKNPKVEEKDDYVDDNPIKVSLYNGVNRATGYQTTLANLKEINVFNIYYTDKDKLDSDYIKYNWKKYYDSYENISKYKTGFYISFMVGEKKIEQLALDPTSKHAMDPYLYIYLYDDVHQIDGAWYSHLEPENYNDETIISSIKLFLGPSGYKITSSIMLTVFTYDKDDFDEHFRYRGKSSHTIEIKTS